MQISDGVCKTIGCSYACAWNGRYLHTSCCVKCRFSNGDEHNSRCARRVCTNLCGKDDINAETNSRVVSVEQKNSSQGCQHENCPYSAQTGYTHCCRECCLSDGRQHGDWCGKRIDRKCDHIYFPFGKDTRKTRSENDRALPYVTKEQRTSPWAALAYAPDEANSDLAHVRTQPRHYAYHSGWTHALDFARHDVPLWMCKQSKESCEEYLYSRYSRRPELASCTTSMRGIDWLAANVRHRSLEVHAIPQKMEFDGECMQCYDLTAWGCEKPLGEVTGLDSCILRCVARQLELYTVLRDAAILVESDNLKRIAFRCHGGTHRSVAVSFLFIALLYPRASFHAHTRRVANAADYALTKCR